LATRRRAQTRPQRLLSLEQLEDRLAPASASFLSPTPNPVSFDSATGLLAIVGQAPDDTARISLTGTDLEVTLDGQAYSSNPASPAFDPALQGVSASKLAFLQFDGQGQGALLLTDFHAAHDLAVRTNAAVRLAGQVDDTGALDVQGQTIEVAGSVRSPDLALTSTGLLTIDLSGRVDASGGTGGQVQINAANVLNAGTISADGSLCAGGSVQVDFSSAYIDTTSALVSASGHGGPGGQVVLSGGPEAHLFSSGSQQATGSVGGTIDLLGRDLVLGGAHADASGNSGGGLIHVGGGEHGADASLPNAQTVQVLADTTLEASAATGGNGGRVIVWANDTNAFAGHVAARGGTAGGDGGFVEVSAGGELTYSGTVDGGAAVGQAGTLLLDPQNLVISSGPASAVPQFQLIDSHPTAGGGFGSIVKVLSNGNVVVTHAGAVYLFGGQTGSLIGALVGAVGVVITTLADGNYIVDSPGWTNGSVAGAGAVTLVSGSTGLPLNGSGTISSSNSLVGSQPNDDVGNGGITALTDGNYVVDNPNWANGSAGRAGAVTLVSGSTGLALDGSGTISASNSLVGSHTNDRVGGSIFYGTAAVTVLADGNYVVDSINWANGSAASAGAVTLVSGSTGLALDGSGTISASNSLVGSHTNDFVGIGGVTALPDGNYVVDSRNWANGSANLTGAVTLVSGSTGLALDGSGTISASNSLVGSHTGDLVGNVGVTVLVDGNYVVDSPGWANGSSIFAGAVTLVSGSTGLALDGSGTISASNSLVGSPGSFGVGNGGVTALADGNYVVGSSGAVTLVSGSTGLALDGSGTISVSNSLVGTAGAVTLLADGDYIVDNPNWANGSASQAGAVTLVSGSTGLALDGSSTISSSNSLVGSQASDEVGYGGVTALADGNYVVDSPNWVNGSASQAGAVTLVSGSTGLAFKNDRGIVSASNSLVGSHTFDEVGSHGITALADGNYVVDSPGWANVGAVTLVSGGTGLALKDGRGTISSRNSLAGSQSGDGVGSGGVTVLADGNYVVDSPDWANGSARFVGAVTLVSGSTGLPLDGSGVVSAQNSLVGLTASAHFAFAALNPVTGTFLAASGNDGTGRVVVGLDNPNQLAYASDQGQDITITPAFLTQTLDSGTAVVLQASNDITVNAPIIVSAGGHGGSLTLQAGRSILLNASITTDNGNLTLIANDLLANGVTDSDRLSGNAVITMAAKTTLNTGTGSLTIDLRAGTGKTNTGSGAITLQTITAASLTVSNNGPSTGSDVVLGRVTTSGPQTYSSPNGTTTVTANLSALNSPITFNGNTVVSSHVHITPGSSTIDFSGSGTQTFTSAVSLGSILHNGSGTLQLTGNLTLTGSFTNTSGTLDTTNRTLKVAGNWTWTAGTFVSTGSTVQLDGGVQTLTSGGQAFNNLTHTATHTLTLADNLALTGAFTNSKGNLDATNRTLQVAGNWTWVAGTFDSIGSTVILTGINQLLSGNTTFFNLSKIVTTADTLTFAAGSTQTIGGTLTLQGAAGNLLALRSSVAGKSWKLKALAGVSVQFADVQFSTAVGAAITDAHGNDSGHNTNWVFTL